MKKLKKILDSEQVSSNVFIGTIFVSIALAILIYFIIDRFELHLENNVTATFAIIASVPTAYLWIVKERKKERELENKKIDLEYKNLQIALHKKEIYQSKVNELNKVYVDAVNQFYGDETFLAGAFALNSLISSWKTLTSEKYEKDLFIKSKVTQIISIIFSRFQEKKKNSSYHSLVVQLIVNNSSGTKSVISDWSLYVLSSIDLSKRNFENISFAKANFNGCNLSSSNLKNSDLSHANLSSANLSNAILSNADLYYTNLSNSKLIGAKLVGSALIGAKLKAAKLTNADLSTAFLNNADLRYSKMEFSNLTGANLLGANLEFANLFSAELGTADLSRCTLKGIDLRFTDLRNVVFSKIVGMSNEDLEFLEETDLSGANLSRSDLRGVNLTFVKLENARLEGADLRGAYLEESFLDGADFTDAIVDLREYEVLKKLNCNLTKIANKEYLDEQLEKDTAQFLDSNFNTEIK